jgi:hypothetical protein
VSAISGATNTGGGGAGVTTGASSDGGGGGGSGECVEYLINNPGGGTQYTYTIGAAGSAGDSTSGAGGTGLIVVDEFY